MDDDATPSTRQKALSINLDPASYGAFAEIGGGQEVAPDTIKARQLFGYQAPPAARR
jgi:hypothetical protein